jgi:hypothetical protein
MRTGRPAYVYFENESGRRTAANLLTRTRRGAAILQVVAATLGLAIAFSPTAFAADDMKKDTMTKDNISKDKMDKGCRRTACRRTA